MNPWTCTNTPLW